MMATKSTEYLSSYVEIDKLVNGFVHKSAMDFDVSEGNNEIVTTANKIVELLKAHQKLCTDVNQFPIFCDKILKGVADRCTQSIKWELGMAKNQEAIGRIECLLDGMLKMINLLDHEGLYFSNWTIKHKQLKQLMDYSKPI